jgi:hypothetical protein
MFYSADTVVSAYLTRTFLIVSVVSKEIRSRLCNDEVQVGGLLKEWTTHTVAVLQDFNPPQSKAPKPLNGLPIFVIWLNLVNEERTPDAGAHQLSRRLA